VISDSTIDPRTLGGIATLLVAGVLCLLYVYRRRTYIVCWVSGWAVMATSMLLAAQRFTSDKASDAAYGVSQFLAWSRFWRSCLQPTPIGLGRALLEATRSSCSRSSCGLRLRRWFYTVPQHSGQGICWWRERSRPPASGICA